MPNCLLSTQPGWNVPLPLHSKVQDELNRIELLDVISPVRDPSPWCGGIVVVPKA